MKIETLAEGAGLARGYLPSAMRDADVVAVTAELAWQEAGVRIARLDYQFMKSMKSWVSREDRICAGIVEVKRRSGNVRLCSYGEYGMEQAKTLAARMGQFPPPALGLKNLALDLGAMESRLTILLPAEPKAHTLALRHEEGRAIWSLVAEEQDGEVVTMRWNANTPADDIIS